MYYLFSVFFMMTRKPFSPENYHFSLKLYFTSVGLYLVIYMDETKKFKTPLC